MTKLHTVNALQRIVPEICVWDYGVDFNKLWRMEGISTDHTIVVWIDTPSDPDVRPVNTEPFLTPYDWAIVACCQQPAMCVTVVDLRAKHHDDAEYGALQWLRTQRPECVPWLRRFVLDDLLDVVDADRLRALLTTRPSYPVGVATVKPRDVLRGLPVSKVDLTVDAGHHAIANLIGPLLLLRNPAEVEDAAGVNHRDALRQILVTNGRVRPADEVASSDTVAIFSPPKLGKFRFVLVDDQWHHGWAEWLSECLQLDWDETRACLIRESAKNAPQCVAGNPDSGASLWVSSTPHWILDRIRTALQGKKRDARFQFRLTNGDGECQETLLLDLRLFPQGSAVESAFAREVAGLARRYTAYGAWKRFTEAELNTIQDQSAGSHIFDRASVLTLLPRLLAQTDPSLPIVLFSSTGRREIVEKLQGYGSILTQFSKPTFFGAPAQDIVGPAEKALATAMQSAQKLALAGKLCRRLLRASEQSRAVNRTPITGLNHFELYLDESGSAALVDDPDATEAEKNRFVIGGLLVGFGNALDDGPFELHRRMEARGLRWWPERFGASYLTKRSNVCDDDLPGGVGHHPDEILGKFFGCLAGMKAFGVCLEYRNSAPPSDKDELRAQWRSDNRYRLVLSTLLELLLCDAIPALANKESTISVFVATRARQAREFRGGESTVRRLQELYGYAGGSSHFQSLSEASVLPVILEMLERRNGRPLGFRLEHARGVRLSYPNLEIEEGPHGPFVRLDQQQQPIIKNPKPAWSLTRHQHYVADIVAHLCWRNGKSFPSKSNVTKLFEDGTYDVLDARLSVLLRAVRALETGDRYRALLELANGDFGPAFERRSVATRLLQRISKAIEEDLTGDEFVLLAHRLEEDTPQAEAASSLAERGSIARFISNRGFGFIKATPANDECFFHIRDWRSATFPTQGESVEFMRSRRNDGQSRASWVRSLA